MHKRIVYFGCISAIVLWKVVNHECIRHPHFTRASRIFLKWKRTATRRPTSHVGHGDKMLRVRNSGRTFMPRRILVADDTPEKLQSMSETVRSSDPRAVIHAATSVRDALRFIDVFGGEITDGVIDFDFVPEKKSGTAIVSALRKKNRRSRITCATARPEGRSFDEAAQDTIAAGADEALCFLREDFAADLRGFLT